MKEPPEHGRAAYVKIDSALTNLSGRHFIARRTLALLVLLAATLIAPASASAYKVPCNTTFEEAFAEAFTEAFTGLRPGTCGELSVPRDHLAGTAGREVLRYRNFPPRRRSRGILVLLAGGPGQPGIIIGSDALLRIAAPRHRVIEFNQRGTAETALRCPKLERVAASAFTLSEATIGAAFSDCAEAIGPYRRFYTSADSARDLDLLRRELGAEKISIVGISYGTYVAQIYARLFPEHVDRLVLDSVVAPDGLDPLSLSNLTATRRIMSQQCRLRACAGVTSNLGGDVQKLIRQIAEGPITGRYVDRRGKRLPGKIDDATTLSAIYSSGDLNPFMRAAFPAAVRAALAGDPAPLIRLQLATSDAPFVPADQLSVGLFAATVCADTRFPWQSGDDAQTRLAGWLAAINSRPDADYAPYGRPATANDFNAGGCRAWPQTSISPTPELPLPDVPTLLLSGRDDVRTPLEDARALATQFPRSRLVAVPGAGHSVLANTLCALRATRRFMRSKPSGKTCRSESIVRPAAFGPIPRSLAQVRPLPGERGRAGRTAEAVLLTLRDVLLSRVISPSSQRVRGLRSGYAEFGEFSGRLKLRRYSYVPGVVVSGTLGEKRGSLRVKGASAARGRLVFRRKRLRGRLGGEPVTLPLSLILRPFEEAYAASARGVGVLVGASMASRTWHTCSNGCRY
jgi:pimeloyl-ACP methyl ester carboxylesterase